MEVYNIRVFLFSLAFAFIPVSYSQNNHLFERKRALYVSAGHLSGKRIVAGIQIQSIDSLNQQVHVKFELLANWKQIDSSEYDLFLDTTKHEFIFVDGHEYEAIQYRSKDSEVKINFEKPREYTYFVRGETEKITIWTSIYATVNQSNRFEKYNRVLKVYYEK